MSTNSFIAKKYENCYKLIYCHWDGYKERGGVGDMLKEFYTDDDKIDELIGLGDISSLEKEIGEKHDFYDNGKKTKDWCKVYMRDRGEEGLDAIEFRDFDSIMKKAKQSGISYIYIWEDGNWTCNGKEY